MPRRPAPPLWSSLALDRSETASLQDQIVGYFRDAVLSGRLKGGARVPSSRVLAADQDVARITVVEAYDRLVAEGFLTSRPGSGLFVAAVQGPPKVRLVAGTPRRSRKRMPELRRNDQVFLVPERPLGLLPLSPGVPALDRFPWRDWARITARLLRERPAHAMGYDDPRGDCGLRQAIAEYLGQARGIACTADQVIVVAGSQQGIDLTARVVAAPGAEAWVEDPGYPAARAALASAGLGIVPVPVGAEGLDAAKGAETAPRARLVLVSPSHQYPLGATMSLRRRLALLDWAERADAWILEDDYDGEYRYGGRPLAPLHTLDRGNRVLYLGTFSKVLAPGLRLGYLVVPEAAIAHFAQLKATTDRHAPGLDQRIVALPRRRPPRGAPPSHARPLCRTAGRPRPSHSPRGGRFPRGRRQRRGGPQPRRAAQASCRRRSGEPARARTPGPCGGPLALLRRPPARARFRAGLRRHAGGPHRASGAHPGRGNRRSATA